MTHIAIQEALDGKAVDWMEKVTDEQYQARARPNERKQHERGLVYHRSRQRHRSAFQEVEART